MTQTSVTSKIGKQDVKCWDGVSNTYTRRTSTGGSLTLEALDWCGVDILHAYGGGTAYTKATIDLALASIGTTNKVAIFLSPGTWTIDANADYSSYKNVEWICPPGAEIDATGFTLTLFRVPNAGRYKVFAGGTVLFSTHQQVFPEWWGAVPGDSATCSATASNKARAAIATLGGEIDFVSGIYYAKDTYFELSSNILLTGKGVYATTLKMADSADLEAVVQNTNWATMLASTANNGRGAWYVAADGVQYRLGLRDIGIDGNKSNNSSGHGVRIYCKTPLLSNVLINNCKEDGLYSRCGNIVGQTTHYDIPQANVTNIEATRCDGIGIRWYGPHDSFLDSIFTSFCGSYGFYLGSGTAYNGSSDIGFLHSYGNNLLDVGAAKTNPGVYIENNCKIVTLMSEDGATIAATAGNTNIHLFYSTFGKYRYHSVLNILGANCTIGHCRIATKAYSTSPTALYIGADANRTRINSLFYYGGASQSNVALDVDASTFSLGHAFLTQNMTADDSWEYGETYAVGDFVDSLDRTPPLNARVFECTTAGTAGSTEPTWDSTIGNTTSDGSVVWTCRALLPNATAIRMGNSAAVKRCHIEKVYATGFSTYVNYVSLGADNYIKLFCPLETGSETLYTGVDPDATDEFEIESLYGSTRAYVFPRVEQVTIDSDVDYTLQAYQSGAWCKITGATATVTFNLPEGEAGMEFWFLRNAAQVLRINPTDTDRITSHDAGKYMQLDATWDNVLLKCHGNQTWVMAGGVGTYSYE